MDDAGELQSKRSKRPREIRGTFRRDGEDIMSRILKLDSQGQPSKWISHQLAIVYHAKNLVAWQLGEGEGDVLYRGGDNRITGTQSRIVTAPIIAIKGEAGG